MLTHRTILCSLALVAVTGACSSGTSSGGQPSTSPSSSPTLSPSPSSPTRTFSADVTNPWFPMPVGARWTYRGAKDGKVAVDRVVVTTEVRTIDGAPCRVLQDKLYLDGNLEETTRDYYSQAQDGTVWYYGEDTAELDEHGKVTSTEGTWHSGSHGAKAGIYMPADPRVGQSMPQERFPGHAEDFFRVLDLGASVSVPFQTASDALLTEEWTPLEPGVLDHKYYARGVGVLKETSVKGPKEELSLVAFTSGT